jgi:hypothetical protein
VGLGFCHYRKERRSLYSSWGCFVGFFCGNLLGEQLGKNVNPIFDTLLLSTMKVKYDSHIRYTVIIASVV